MLQWGVLKTLLLLSLDIVTSHHGTTKKVLNTLKTGFLAFASRTNVVAAWACPAVSFRARWFVCEREALTPALRATPLPLWERGSMI
jgi:hypothetical protein